MSSEWKIERNLCRCCHSEGTFRTMGVPCYDQGHLEVFSEMIQETFDIGMTPVAGPLCMVTYTICEVCILKLRDAHSFKKQVIKCEERFRDMYRRNYIKVDIDIEVKEEHAYPEEIKVETYQEQQDQLGMDDHHNYEDDPGDCTIILEGDNSEPELSIKQELDNKKTKGKAKSAAKTKKVPKAARTKKKASVPSEEAEKTPDEGASKPKKKKVPQLRFAKIYQKKYQPYFKVIGDHDEKQFNCLKCDKIYKSTFLMLEHLQNKHIVKKCPLCEEEFVDVVDKKKHLEEKHRMEEWGRTAQLLIPCQKYICDYCRREFKKKFYLQKHIDLMHGESKCVDCNQVFPNKILPYHRDELHGDKLPSCGICDFKSVMKLNVLYHQRRVHMKEKNVSCSKCGMQFFDKQRLARHMIKHETEKKFECTYCNKKFARPSSLRLHVKIHTGEKNKICPVCDQRFVQKASLNYHMTRYHPNERVFTSKPPAKPEHPIAPSSSGTSSILFQRLTTLTRN